VNAAAVLRTRAVAVERERRRRRGTTAVRVPERFGDWLAGRAERTRACRLP
jgi:hypothetical protein